MTTSARCSGSRRASARSTRSRSANRRVSSWMVGCVDGEDLDLDGPPSATAGLVEAGVHEQAVEPRIEPLGITQPGQVTPGSHQGVLDRIARELAVPEDEARGRVEPGGRRGREHGEGVVIASPRPLHELPPVHRPLVLARPPWPGLQGMASAQADSFRGSPGQPAGRCRVEAARAPDLGAAEQGSVSRAGQRRRVGRERGQRRASSQRVDLGERGPARRTASRARRCRSARASPWRTRCRCSRRRSGPTARRR